MCVLIVFDLSAVAVASLAGEALFTLTLSRTIIVGVSGTQKLGLAPRKGVFSLDPREPTSPMGAGLENAASRGRGPGGGEAQRGQ